MSETNGKKFIDELLEDDIQKLKEEMAKVEERPEAKGMTPKEKAYESLKAWRNAGPEPPAPQAQTVLPQYLKSSPPEIQLQVEKLIDIALHQGLETAFREAKKAGSFVLDAFHDTIVNKIYPEINPPSLP